jgi:hypothetical protein
VGAGRRDGCMPDCDRGCHSNRVTWPPCPVREPQVETREFPAGSSPRPASTMDVAPSSNTRLHIYSSLHFKDGETEALGDTPGVAHEAPSAGSRRGGSTRNRARLSPPQGTDLALRGVPTGIASGRFLPGRPGGSDLRGTDGKARHGERGTCPRSAGGYGRRWDARPDGAGRGRDAR